MTFAHQVSIVIVSLLAAIAWGIARGRHRSRQIREEQHRHWAVHERACAATTVIVRLSPVALLITMSPEPS